MRAICVQCGSVKTAPSRKCRRCGLDPKRDDDLLVKSVYLSQDRFDDPKEQQRCAEELPLFAEMLKAGGQISFDEHDLERLRGQLGAVREVRWWNVFGALLRIFLPAILALGAVYGALWALKNLR